MSDTAETKSENGPEILLLDDVVEGPEEIIIEKEVGLTPSSKSSTSSNVVGEITSVTTTESSAPEEDQEKSSSLVPSSGVEVQQEETKKVAEHTENGGGGSEEKESEESDRNRNLRLGNLPLAVLDDLEAGESKVHELLSSAFSLPEDAIEAVRRVPVMDDGKEKSSYMLVTFHSCIHRDQCYTQRYKLQEPITVFSDVDNPEEKVEETDPTNKDDHLVKDGVAVLDKSGTLDSSGDAAKEGTTNGAAVQQGKGGLSRRNRYRRARRARGLGQNRKAEDGNDSLQDGEEGATPDQRLEKKNTPVFDWNGAPEFQWKVISDPKEQNKIIIENVCAGDLMNPFLYNTIMRCRAMSFTCAQQNAKPGELFEQNVMGRGRRCAIVTFTSAKTAISVHMQADEIQLPGQERWCKVFHNQGKHKMEGKGKETAKESSEKNNSSSSSQKRKFDDKPNQMNEGSVDVSGSEEQTKRLKTVEPVPPAQNGGNKAEQPKISLMTNGTLSLVNRGFGAGGRGGTGAGTFASKQINIHTGALGGQITFRGQERGGVTFRGRGISSGIYSGGGGRAGINNRPAGGMIQPWLYANVNQPVLGSTPGLSATPLEASKNYAVMEQLLKQQQEKLEYQQQLLKQQDLINQLAGELSHRKSSGIGTSLTSVKSPLSVTVGANTGLPQQSQEVYGRAGSSQHTVPQNVPAFAIGGSNLTLGSLFENRYSRR